MALATSGKLSLDDIGRELEANPNFAHSLREFSLIAYNITGLSKFTEPHKVSDFYGFDYVPEGTVQNLGGGFAITTTTSAGGTMSLAMNDTFANVYTVGSAPTYQQISVSQLPYGLQANIGYNFVRLYRDSLSNNNAYFTLSLTAASGYDFSNISFSIPSGFTVRAQTANATTIYVEAEQTNTFTSIASLYVYFDYMPHVTWYDNILGYSDNPYPTATSENLWNQAVAAAVDEMIYDQYNNTPSYQTDVPIGYFAGATTIRKSPTQTTVPVGWYGWSYTNISGSTNTYHKYWNGTNFISTAWPG
jgi:hypothetical protein